jgi:hypothetical protein
VNEDGGVGFVARYQPIPGLTCNVVDGVTFLTRICIVYVWPGSTALCGVWQIRDGAAVALGTVKLEDVGALEGRAGRGDNPGQARVGVAENVGLVDAGSDGVPAEVAARRHDLGEQVDRRRPHRPFADRLVWGDPSIERAGGVVGVEDAVVVAQSAGHLPALDLVQLVLTAPLDRRLVQCAGRDLDELVPRGAALSVPVRAPPVLDERVVRVEGHRCYLLNSE